MTVQKRAPVEHHVFQKSDRVFLDANIWLFLYGPQQPKDKTEIYSDALNRMLTARSRIYIDLFVVSEVINAFARMRWRLNETKRPFKKFRNSTEFIPIAEEIADYVRRIVKMCSRIENSYGEINVAGWMDEYETGGHDFNDQVIRDLCKKRGWTILTDDGDFAASGVSVLTANCNLLQTRD